MKRFFIGVAGHKLYKMPKDSLYTPIQVGSSGKMTIDGFLRDDSGDNISDLNSNFSELTGLYYIWKNIDAKYKGLVHYRRYLGMHNHKFSIKKKQMFENILNHDDLESLFNNSDVILPKKRNYYIETNYSHYVHAHSAEGLMYTKEIISEKYPEYLNTYNDVMGSKSAHMFNMFIMKEKLFNEYCTWLFSILFNLKDKIDISKYSGQEARIFGYISELLLDVWLKKNKVHSVEVPVIYIEKQHVLIKGFNFIKRKMLGHGNSHIRSSVD